jgi:hypothetical protein
MTVALWGTLTYDYEWAFVCVVLEQDLGIVGALEQVSQLEYGV